MYYVLMDITGNMLASYRNAQEARAALARIVEDDPSAEDEIALLTYDDEGGIADSSLTVPTGGGLAPVRTDQPVTLGLYEELFGLTFRQGVASSGAQVPVGA